MGAAARAIPSNGSTSLHYFREDIVLLLCNDEIGRDGIGVWVETTKNDDLRLAVGSHAEAVNLLGYGFEGFNPDR